MMDERKTPRIFGKEKTPKDQAPGNKKNGFNSEIPETIAQGKQIGLPHAVNA